MSVKSEIILHILKLLQKTVSELNMKQTRVAGAKIIVLCMTATHS